METDKTIGLVIGIIITALMVPIGISAINNVDFSISSYDGSPGIDHFSVKRGSPTYYNMRNYSYVDLTPGANTSFYFNLTAVTMVAGSRNITISFTSTNTAFITDHEFAGGILVDGSFVEAGNYNLTDMDEITGLAATALSIEFRVNVTHATTVSFNLTISVAEEYIKDIPANDILNTLFKEILPLLIIIGIILGASAGIVIKNKNGGM